MPPFFKDSIPNHFLCLNIFIPISYFFFCWNPPSSYEISTFFRKPPSTGTNFFPWMTPNRHLEFRRIKMKMTLPLQRKLPLRFCVWECVCDTLTPSYICIHPLIHTYTHTGRKYVSPFELCCSWSKIHFPKTCHKNANFMEVRWCVRARVDGCVSVCVSVCIDDAQGCHQKLTWDFITLPAIACVASFGPLLLLFFLLLVDARRARRHVVDSVVNIFITELYASRATFS